MAERFKVIWTRTVVVDLDLIVDFVAADASVDRALQLYERIRDKVDTLPQLPRRGRIVPELQGIGVAEFREILMDRYRIIFRIDGKKVVLIGIFDGRPAAQEPLTARR